MGFTYNRQRVRCLEIGGDGRTCGRPGRAGRCWGRGGYRDHSDHPPSRIISFGIDDSDTDPHLLAADNRDV